MSDDFRGEREELEHKDNIRENDTSIAWGRGQGRMLRGRVRTLLPRVHVDLEDLTSLVAVVVADTAWWLVSVVRCWSASRNLVNRRYRSLTVLLLWDGSRLFQTVVQSSRTSGLVGTYETVLSFWPRHTWPAQPRSIGGVVKRPRSVVRGSERRMSPVWCREEAEPVVGSYGAKLPEQRPTGGDEYVIGIKTLVSSQILI